MKLKIPQDQLEFYPAPLSCRQTFNGRSGMLSNFNCLNYALDYWEYAWARPDTFSAWIGYDRDFTGTYRKGDDPGWELRNPHRRNLTIDFKKHVTEHWKDVIDFTDDKALDPFFRDCAGAGLIPVKRPVTAGGYRLIAHIQDKYLLKRHEETMGMQGKDAHWIRLDRDGYWTEKFGDGDIQAFKSGAGQNVILPHRELAPDRDDQKYVFVQYYLAPVDIHHRKPSVLPFAERPIVLEPCD